MALTAPLDQGTHLVKLPAQPINLFLEARSCLVARLAAFGARRAARACAARWLTASAAGARLGQRRRAQARPELYRRSLARAGRTEFAEALLLPAPSTDRTSGAVSQDRLKVASPDPSCRRTSSAETAWVSRSLPMYRENSRSGAQLLDELVAVDGRDLVDVLLPSIEAMKKERDQPERARDARLVGEAGDVREVPVTRARRGG